MKIKSNKLGMYSILATVSLLISQSVDAEVNNSVRGVVKSSGEATITVDHSERVLETPVRTGEYFKHGDILMKFDCEALLAEKQAMHASYKAAKSSHANNVELQSHGAIGEIEVEVSASQMKEALARSQAMNARTKNCVIEAPFNGRVADLLINQHETPAQNQPLIKIVGTDDLELRLIAPSNWLSWMTIGSVFEFEVDETGMRYEASVTNIGAEVDAVSRTVSIVAGFSELPDRVLPGMSGTAFFNESWQSSSNVGN